MPHRHLSATSHPEPLPRNRTGPLYGLPPLCGNATVSTAQATGPASPAITATAAVYDAEPTHRRVNAAPTSRWAVRRR
ncbi:hypothetical protein [Nocardia vaccinii]|uniref:hypothetical protein n=1 Tax=Nocardia vaccinii TaxID=1822 RepID=UPI0008379FF0|nr:hypothetical protein [Nocardia vaccinii]